VGGFGEISKESITQVREALDIVGLKGFETRALGTLSSGQLQRVLFARLLVQDAELILLDEPFNAVDTQTTAALLSMVTRWHHEKRTVVAVLHDETQVLLNFPQILFGSALGVDPKGLVLVAGMATISLLILAWMYRGMVLETFDPLFLITSRRQTSSRNSRRGHWESMAWHHGFLFLVVANLVAGFQTLGTLMAVGLMMVPAVSSRMWHVSLVAQLLNASLQAMLASMAGLLLSYHFDTPSGPTIIGCAGVLYFLSLVIAPGGWLPRWRQPRHKLA